MNILQTSTDFAQDICEPLTLMPMLVGQSYAATTTFSHSHSRSERVASSGQASPPRNMISKVIALMFRFQIKKYNLEIN